MLPHISSPNPLDGVEVKITRKGGACGSLMGDMFHVFGLTGLKIAEQDFFIFGVWSVWPLPCAYPSCLRQRFAVMDRNAALTFLCKVAAVVEMAASVSEAAGGDELDQRVPEVSIVTTNGSDLTV